MNAITITPPLTLDEMKSFGEFRIVVCVPSRRGGAGSLLPREGMNYTPSWVVEHIQSIVDHFPTHDFDGYVEMRNSSASNPPVSRYYMRGRRVEQVDAVVFWPDPDMLADDEDDEPTLCPGCGHWVASHYTGLGVRSGCGLCNCGRSQDDLPSRYEHNPKQEQR